MKASLLGDALPLVKQIRSEIAGNRLANGLSRGRGGRFREVRFNAGNFIVGQAVELVHELVDPVLVPQGSSSRRTSPVGLAPSRRSVRGADDANWQLRELPLINCQIAAAEAFGSIARGEQVRDQFRIEQRKEVKRVQLR